MEKRNHAWTDNDTQEPTNLHVLRKQFFQAQSKHKLLQITNNNTLRSYLLLSPSLSRSYFLLWGGWKKKIWKLKYCSSCCCNLIFHFRATRAVDKLSQHICEFLCCCCPWCNGQKKGLELTLNRSIRLAFVREWCRAISKQKGIKKKEAKAFLWEACSAGGGLLLRQPPTLTLCGKIERREKATRVWPKRRSADRERGSSVLRVDLCTLFSDLVPVSQSLFFQSSTVMAISESDFAASTPQKKLWGG